MSPVKVSLPLSDCRYWLQGFCFRSRDCRFNHPPEKKGQESRTRSIDCQYWIQGYCFHGDGCRFRHVPEKMGCSWWKANKRGEHLSHHAYASSTDFAEPIIRGTGTESPTTEKEPCSICMEVPTKYGILSDCDHAFCYGKQSIYALCCSVDPNCPIRLHYTVAQDSPRHHQLDSERGS